jgi:hypothetical protein
MSGCTTHRLDERRNHVYLRAGLPPEHAREDADIERAWSDWFGTIGAQIADFGNRVGAARMVGQQPAGQDGLTGYVVINADTLDAAVEIAGGCPGLRSGGRVEVGTVVPAQ